MKNSIIEAKLKKVYAFGLITEKEFYRLLKQYQREGVSNGFKIEAIDLLEKSLRHYETKEEKLAKKEKFLQSHLTELQKRRNKTIGDKKAVIMAEKKHKFEDIRRRQKKRLTDITIELSQVDQKIKLHQEKARQEIDLKKIDDIRQKIR